MEKNCCEFKHEGTEITAVETEDGYRIEIKGDKEKIRALKQLCCGEGGFKFSCCQ